MNLNIESWTAVAPSLETIDAWQAWFDDGLIKESSLDSKPLALKKISPLLRRRFSKLGKLTATAVLNLNNEASSQTTVYASRHGDTALTLSLLNDMGLVDEPMSPTNFSLAVHNAIGGLMSIAQKDHAPMTAIASMDKLVLSCLQEAHAQLEVFDKVLCVIYDSELPDLYARYCQSLAFPVAVAFVLSRSEQGNLRLINQKLANNTNGNDDQIIDLVAMLLGKKKSLSFYSGNSHWILSLEQNS